MRCSLGRATTEADIDYVLEVLDPAVARIRALSPAAAAPAPMR